MAQGILLDSSVVIPHLRGHLDLAFQVPSSEPLFLSLTALGELYKGVLKSIHPEKGRGVLDAFLQTVSVLHPDAATARIMPKLPLIWNEREHPFRKMMFGSRRWRWNAACRWPLAMLTLNGLRGCKF